MSVSNHRIREYDTIHHLTSRIAHQFYFLDEDARNDFLAFVMRVTEFAGLELIGWCVMTNHFHLLVYLPEPPQVSDEEVRRRYDILKGVGRAAVELRNAEDVDAQRRRMYDVGNYMKMVKQWFTEDYNQRNGHKGTMWESVYHDTPVPLRSNEMAKRLAYLNLNPVRAAITPEFASYRWSSLTAFCAGDARARKGMRFVYGDGMTDEEMLAYHMAVMSDLLEEWKLRRATEIARKRAAGFDEPADALTSEALIAQAAAQMREARRECAELHEAREKESSRSAARALAESQIVSALYAEGPLTLQAIAEKLDLPQRSAYRYLNNLQKRGQVVRPSHAAPWQVVAKSGQT